MVIFSGLMLESMLFMDNIGNGKKVATPDEGLSLLGDDLLIFVFVFLSLALSDLRSSLVGCWVLLLCRRAASIIRILKVNEKPCKPYTNPTFSHLYI